MKKNNIIQPKELRQLTKQLQRIRQSHAKTTNELWKLEQQIYSLTIPYLPKKNKSSN